jgi:hypothetical protein
MIRLKEFRYLNLQSCSLILFIKFLSIRINDEFGLVILNHSVQAKVSIFKLTMMKKLIILLF